MTEFRMANQNTLEDVQKSLGKSTDAPDSNGASVWGRLKDFIGIWTKEKSYLIDANISSRASREELEKVKSDISELRAITDSVKSDTHTSRWDMVRLDEKVDEPVSTRASASDLEKLESILGHANPSAADMTSVMNYLKLLESKMGSSSSASKVKKTRVYGRKAYAYNVMPTEPILITGSGVIRQIALDSSTDYSDLPNNPKSIYKAYPCFTIEIDGITQTFTDPKIFMQYIDASGKGSQSNNGRPAYLVHSLDNFIHHSQGAMDVANPWGLSLESTSRNINLSASSNDVRWINPNLEINICFKDYFKITFTGKHSKSTTGFWSYAIVADVNE